MVEIRRARIFVLLIACGCGPKSASDGEDSSEGEDTSSGTDASEEDWSEDTSEDSAEDTGPKEPKSCEPGWVLVLEFSDICSSYCMPLPASCGDAPSCDPACNWDLCQTVSCMGEVTEICDSFSWVEETGWGCPTRFGPCNPWLIQHCVPDEQCVPYGPWSADEWWTSARCMQGQTAKIGEPCSRLQGIYDGVDTCEAGAVCWDVDPDTALGICVPLCSGAPHDPSCPPGSACVLAHPMWAAFCLPPCDPFADECSPGYACTLVGETLACMPAASQTAALGQPCEHPNECGSARACVDACAGEHCCVEFCDLQAPACPEPTSCVPISSDPSSQLGVCA